MELDEDLQEILNEFGFWKTTVSELKEKVKVSEILVSTMKNNEKYLKDEINYLNNQIGRKDRILNEFKDIMKHFNSTEEKYFKLEKDKEAVDNEIITLKKELDAIKNAWKMEKESYQRNTDKIIEAEQKRIGEKCNDLKKELENTKEENKLHLQYEKQQHLNEVNYFKQLLTQNVENYEEKLMKMNGDLAAAQIEIKNLRQRCAAGANIFKINPTLPKEEKTKEKAMPTAAKSETSKIKFPVAKKRKLYNPNDDDF